MPIVKKYSKPPTELSLPIDVYTDAKARGINLSQASARHARQAIGVENSRQWAARYANFISAYNESVGSEGLPLEQWRFF